jgi:hypothetical protein
VRRGKRVNIGVWAVERDVEVVAESDEWLRGIERDPKRRLCLPLSRIVNRVNLKLRVIIEAVRLGIATVLC